MAKKVSEREKVNIKSRKDLLEINTQANLDFNNQSPWFFDDNLFNIELQKRVKKIREENKTEIAEKLAYAEMNNEILLNMWKFSNQAFLISNKKNIHLDQLNTQKNINSGNGKRDQKKWDSYQRMYQKLSLAIESGQLKEKLSDDLVTNELIKENPKAGWETSTTAKMYSKNKKESKKKKPT
jgi:hypothetical protein